MISYRPRLTGDVEPCVRLLDRVHTVDGYPPLWPVDLTEFIVADQELGAWVAERDGIVVGVCEMEPPESAEWVTGSVTPPPDGSTTAYLGLLHVSPGERGLGIGAWLVRAAHARAAAAGAGQVVLHHAAVNPLSVPFWGRAGYRSLLTGWVRHPA